MKPRTIRRVRRWAKVAAIVGIAFQAGTCNVDANQLALIVQDISGLAIREGANLVADAVFFLLDNILVRLTV